MGRVRELSAREILAAAQRGDVQAQAAVFNEHKQRVAHQVLRMTGDASVVDDLVQEVFIAAFSALPGFRGDAQLDTWLYTIASNKVRNWWDAARRRTVREQRSGEHVREAPTTPDETIEQAEHRARLYAAIGQLPDKFREAFHARAIENLSLQEASELLGIPVSTVSYRTRRAERMLCELLGIEEAPQ